MVTSRSLTVTRSPDGRISDASTATADLAQSRRDREAAGLEAVVDRHRHRHRAHEVEALGAGVLACRLAQLVVERLVDVGEPGVILGAELEAEVVGHDAPALDVDAAVVVHFAQQSPAELDRTNAGMRTT